MVPSLRLTVPSSEAFTPLPAAGLPCVVTGTQAIAHVPEQWLLPLVSFSKRYSVRPFELTTTLPRSPTLRRLIFAPPAASADAAPSATMTVMLRMTESLRVMSTRDARGRAIVPGSLRRRCRAGGR